MSWEPGVITLRDSAGQDKEIYAPLGHFSILGHLGKSGIPLSSCARNAAKCSSCRGWHWHIWSLCRDTRLCGCIAGASGLSIIGWSAPIRTVGSLYRSTIKLGNLFKKKQQKWENSSYLTPKSGGLSANLSGGFQGFVRSTIDIRCRVGGDDSSGWWRRRGIWGWSESFSFLIFLYWMTCWLCFRVTKWLPKNLTLWDFTSVDIIDDPRYRHSVTGSDGPQDLHCTWAWTGWAWTGPA